MDKILEFITAYKTDFLYCMYIKSIAALQYGIEYALSRSDNLFRTINHIRDLPGKTTKAVYPIQWQYRSDMFPLSETGPASFLRSLRDLIYSRKVNNETQRKR